MMDIIDKIKALPDGKTLLYAVMTGMQVEGYNSAHFTTDDLKALVAEVERIAKELGVSEQRFRIAVENFLAWFGSRAEWERENRNAKPVTRQDVIAMRDALRASDYVAEDARAKMEELND